MTPVLQGLADKDKLVRSVNLEAIESWKLAVGAESIMNLIGKIITPDNPEIRTCLLKFLIENKDAINKCEVEQLIKPLVDCLQDKTPEIRKLTEDVILEVMRVASHDSFIKNIQDLKPAVKQTIKPILDACKMKIGSTGGEENPFDVQMDQEEEVKIPSKALPAKPSTASATSR